MFVFLIIGPGLLIFLLISHAWAKGVNFVLKIISVYSGKIFWYQLVLVYRFKIIAIIYIYVYIIIYKICIRMLKFIIVYFSKLISFFNMIISRSSINPLIK